MRDAVAILKDLIKIDTTNPPGDEEKLLSYLEGMFVQEKIEYLHQETAPGRGNVIAWIPANEKVVRSPLILLSHIDVVAAIEDQWDYPPFAAIEKDGYIYGRGCVDTKQLTVMELMAFLKLKDSQTHRDRDVYFIATCDEESGSEYGLKWLLSHEVTVNKQTMTGEELFRDADVVSEGGGFPIVAGDKEFYLCESGQKSCGSVTFNVESRKAKGGYLQSPDAMVRAMSLIEDIGKLELEGKTLKTVEKFENKLKGARLSPMMQKILQAMKHNTMTVTMVSGKNTNAVTVTCDVRLLPGFVREDLEKTLNSLSQKWDCTYKILSLGKGYECNPEGQFLTILEKATLERLGKTRDDVEILPFVSMGSSDGHYLVDSGARVFGYSPVYSWDMTFDTAVTMVHGINERIHKDSVVLGSDILTAAVAMAVEGVNEDE